jgi:hypothetical protein
VCTIILIILHMPTSIALAPPPKDQALFQDLTNFVLQSHWQLTGREPGTGGMPSASSCCAAAGMPAASASCPCCACTHTSTHVHRKHGTTQLVWLHNMMMTNSACVLGGLNQCLRVLLPYCWLYDNTG